MLRLRRDHPSDVICSLVLRSQKRKDKRMCYKVVLPHLQKSYSLEPVVVVKYSCVHSVVTTNVIRIQVLLSQLLTRTHTHTKTQSHSTMQSGLALLLFSIHMGRESVAVEEASLMLWVDDTP